MLESFAALLEWYCVALGLWAIVATIRHRHFSNPMFYALAVLEIGLLVLLIWSLAALGEHHDIETGLFLSYFLVTLVIAPAAVLWGVADKSRWGTGVVVVGMWTVAILLVRLMQIWST